MLNLIPIYANCDETVNFLFKRDESTEDEKIIMIYI
jgi:hypothetical protein